MLRWTAESSSITTQTRKIQRGLISIAHFTSPMRLLPSRMLHIRFRRALLIGFHKQSNLFLHDEMHTCLRVSNSHGVWSIPA
jgi:hypothetical protein